MNQLEEFITQNRAAFDAAEPDAKVWTAIEKTLDQAAGKSDDGKPKSAGRVVSLSGNKGFRMMAAAASLLLVGAIAGFLFAKQNQSQTVENESIALVNVSPEAAEAEAFYVRSISVRSDELAAHEYHNDQVEGDLAAIDQAMIDIKKELANVPPARREQVVNALIENYQIKLKILEKVLNCIETPAQTPSLVDSLNIQNARHHDSKSI